MTQNPSFLFELANSAPTMLGRSMLRIPSRMFSSSPGMSANIGAIFSNLQTPAVPPSLSEPFNDDLPTVAELPSELPAPVVTTLPNGVRVATQETFEEATSLGIFVDVGSRHEMPEQSGVTHLLEKMAFQSCQNFSKARVMYEIEMMGANVICNRSRETMIYGADVLRECAGDMTEVLLECITKPKFDAVELAAQKKQIVRRSFL